MGEEADFDSPEGVANPALVAKLRSLDKAPEDPELLASLIDGLAGIDLGFGAFALGSRVGAVRRKALPGLRSAQKVARKLVELDVEPSLNLLELAIRDLLPRSAVLHDSKLAQRAAAAVALLADLPLKQGASSLAHKPKSDEAVSNVVLAVGTYFTSRGQPFSGEPRSAMISGKFAHEIKSEQAQLTHDVLELLHMGVPGSKLATHMLKAKKRLSRK